MTLEDEIPDHADDEPDIPTCGQPCDPAQPCDQCDEYWQRMEREGFWDMERHRWTDKGWASICRTF